MEREYLDAYTHIYNNHWWWRARERFLARTLAALSRGLPENKTRHILDVGCGDGLAFPMLSRFGSVSGIEPALSGAAAPPRPDIYYGPLETFAAHQKFDWICMFDVLEHLDDRVPTLQRLGGMLTDEGVFILTVPALQWLWTKHDDLNHHRVRYSLGSLRTELHAAGFIPIQMRYFFHWMVGPKLLTRMLENIQRSEPGLPRIPPPLLNQLLIGISDLDARFGAVLPIPFGSSVFGVFKRTSL